MQVLLQVATIFLLMLMGLSAMKLRLVDSKGVSMLSAVVLYFAQPCLILDKMQQDVTPQLLLELGWMFVLTCVIMSASGLIAWQLFRRQPHDRRAVLSNLVMASNCGFMGYPVITAAMGQEALIYAVMYVSAFNVICWTLGAYFFRGISAVSPKRIITNPTILSVLAGTLLLCTGWRLPSFVNDALRSMGGITTPVAMFVIGARLVGLRPSDLKDRSMLLACGLRLLAVPLMVLLCLRFTPLPTQVIGALYLCSAMPGASLSAMQSDLFDCEAELASRSVAVSTALSMATIPLLLLC